jgi:hypothetical protein
MPGRERSKLFKRLFRHPDNEPVNDFRASARKLIQMGEELLHSKTEVADLSQLLAELEQVQTEIDAAKSYISGVDTALKGWGEALGRLDDSVPKRQMSKERVETARAYLRLRDQHGKEIVALHALVNLPSEQQKGYAKKYRESRDEEALRNYVKSLMANYRRHQERDRTRSDFWAEAAALGSKKTPPRKGRPSE